MTHVVMEFADLDRKMIHVGHPGCLPNLRYINYSTKTKSVVCVSETQRCL